MLTSLLLSALALAQPDAEPDRDPDVVAKRTLLADPATIHAYLLDLRNYQELWPESCVAGWEYGSSRQGVGASAEVTYMAPGWRRKLTVVITKETPSRIELDHPGKKGFITTLSFEPAELGTAVEMHTWLNEPPWPVIKYYYNRVQPYWQDCQQSFVDNLAAKLNK